jgi:hypothetical protein
MQSDTQAAAFREGNPFHGLRRERLHSRTPMKGGVAVPDVLPEFQNSSRI